MTTFGLAAPIRAPQISGSVSVSGDVQTAGWLANAVLNEWYPISGTTGAGGSAIDAFGGFALREDISELCCLANGGHLDSADNSVTSILLTDNAPAWTVRKASTWNGSEIWTSAGVSGPEASYRYADGSPPSRHTYRHNYWNGTLNRYLMVGMRSGYGNTPSNGALDGFNPDTNAWDAENTWPDVPQSPVSNTYGVVKDGSGAIWTNGHYKLSASGTWSTPGITGGTALWRTPVVYDSTRDQLVCVMWGDGFNSGTGVNASRIPLSGTTRIDITFNSSAGLTQFTADTPSYAGADYCPDNDKILFFDGKSGKQGRFYWITPANSGNWDIEVATFGSGSATIPVVGSGGTNGKLWYVPALHGFVLMPTSASGLYFLRTA